MLLRLGYEMCPSVWSLVGHTVLGGHETFRRQGLAGRGGSLRAGIGRPQAGPVSSLISTSWFFKMGRTHTVATHHQRPSDTRPFRPQWADGPSKQRPDKPFFPRAASATYQGSNN